MLTFMGEFLEQGDALVAGGGVQTGSGLVKEHDGRVVDQLERDGQPLPLAPADVGAPGTEVGYHHRDQ